jgi:hypothetical protein
MMSRCSRCKREIEKKGLPDLIALFKPWIRFPKDAFQNLRNRNFTPPLTFWLFLYQIISPKGSCKMALCKAWTSLFLKKGKKISMNTSAYCQARKKLPLDGIRSIFSSLFQKRKNSLKASFLWFGRMVKIVDGTTVNMPDTPENQKAFPQTKGQKPGCGFPIARIVVLFSLNMGGILDWIMDQYVVSETSLFRRLFQGLSEKDVILGDRLFSSYCDIFFLTQKKVDIVMRCAKRKRKRILKRLGKRDHLVIWEKSLYRPPWIDVKTWKNIPETLTLREISYRPERAGFRSEEITLVTTLLDPKMFPKKAFEELYYKRWRAELFLRDVKTTMGMDMLSCKSPEMVVKEILFHFIAYNLIRLVIFEAGEKCDVSWERISFKGAIDVIREFIPLMDRFSGNKKKLRELTRRMLECIASNKVPLRPYRKEPRALKKRLKRYQLLTKHRAKFKEDPHRGKKRASLT